MNLNRQRHNLCVKLVIVIIVNISIVIKAQNEQDWCDFIGGVCQNVNSPCDANGNKLYDHLCSNPSQSCCALKTSESACKAVAGSCGYKCSNGSVPLPDKCEGHMKCCVNLV